MSHATDQPIPHVRPAVDETDSAQARRCAVRAVVAEGLADHDAANPASSTRIRRFLVLETPPDQSAHEITEKGYVNQRTVQERRADDVGRLCGRGDTDDVVTVADMAC